MKDRFDCWHPQEHMPDALKAFEARRAWRGWSAVDASMHYAAYPGNKASAA